MAVGQFSGYLAEHDLLRLFPHFKAGLCFSFFILTSGLDGEAARCNGQPRKNPTTFPSRLAVSTMFELSNFSETIVQIASLIGAKLGLPASLESSREQLLSCCPVVGPTSK